MNRTMPHIGRELHGVPFGTMNRLVSLALLVGGIALTIYGIDASRSLGSDLSRFFTGSPTNKTIGLLIGGIVVTAVGAGGLARGSKSP
jgi:hypothetical protein